MTYNAALWVVKCNLCQRFLLASVAIASCEIQSKTTLHIEIHVEISSVVGLILFFRFSIGIWSYTLLDP